MSKYIVGMSVGGTVQHLAVTTPIPPPVRSLTNGRSAAAAAEFPGASPTGGPGGMGGGAGVVVGSGVLDPAAFADSAVDPALLLDGAAACSDGIPTAESQAPTSAIIAISGSAVRQTRLRRGEAALFFT
ncbi:hypothetical protein [Rhodococcoides fascians]|uniref:hypothetical protein n=1 Tax=Rhodococcoides fascians TaxID=1828 RepID=UPI000AEA242F|nr:hypothetical protein [Rhodococcus fascians]